MNSSDHIGHPNRRHTDHSRRFPGHRDSDPDGRPIFVGFRFGNDRRLDGNRRPGAAYLAIGAARYSGPGRIVARPDENMYSWT